MEQLREGLWDLGEWRPKLPVTEGQWRKFLQGVPELCYYIHPGSNEIRNPKTNKEIFTRDKVNQWHQDGLYIHCNLLIVWANCGPTELRDYNSKEQIKLSSCHVYAFINDNYEHRTPQKIYKTRWFCRANGWRQP